MLYSQSPPLAKTNCRRKRRLAGLRAIWTAVPNRGLAGGPRMRRFIPFLPRSRPSIGRRMFRALTRFSIAVLIGVGATLGWQAYGDEARQMLAVQAPELARMLPAIP